MAKNADKRAKQGARTGGELERAEKPARTVPTWLRRVGCFLGALFCAFGVLYAVMVFLVGKGSPIFIVAIVVFGAMALHLIRAGLGDGRWRAERPER